MASESNGPILNPSEQGTSDGSDANPLRAASMLHGHKGGPGFLGRGVFSKYLFGDDFQDSSDDSLDDGTAGYGGPSGPPGGDMGDTKDHSGGLSDDSSKDGDSPDNKDGLDSDDSSDSPVGWGNYGDDSPPSDDVGTSSDPYAGPYVIVTPGGPCDFEGAVDYATQLFLSNLYDEMHLPPGSPSPDKVGEILLVGLEGLAAFLGTNTILSGMAAELLNIISGAASKTGVAFFTELNDLYWQIDDALRVDSMNQYMEIGGVLDDACQEVYDQLSSLHLS